jgi:CelD/BcsL family acetyltransferase involved in cellulose biosynthesis
VSAPTVAFASPAAPAEVKAEWADLCARAAPNPFAEPGFLLPLLAYERPRRLSFALVRNAEGRLIGFCALVMPRAGLARVWMSPYATLPAAAFDRDEAPAALEALHSALGERTRLAGIVWPYVETDSPFSTALRTLALPRLLAGRRQRAALRLAGAGATQSKTAAKQARRLAALGNIETTCGPDDIEAFLEVERKGWKGERRTALADDPARAAFARAALGGFAREGRLVALSLRLDGAPIAAALVLTAGGRAFYWKTAYDEAYAEHSPGVQATLALTRRLTETPGLTLADSCASEDHPMINRVWPDKLAFEDWAVALRPEGERPLAMWAALAQARASAREAVKRGAYRALGRKRA